MPSEVQGLIAATFSPTHADGRAAPERVQAVADSLIEDGVDGVFVGGTTGEGISLDLESREALAAAWVGATRERIPSIVHVGHASLADAQRLARHANDVAASAICVSIPGPLRPKDLGGLVDVVARVADAAPALPCWYYHIPALTGVEARMREFLPIAKQRVPSLVGIKFSDRDLDDLVAAARYDDGRFAMLFGCDEMLIAGLSCGAVGAVGSTYNYAAPLYKRVIAALEAEELDEARRLQALSVELVDVQIRHGGLPAFKATMDLLGLDCGPPLAPLRALSEDEVAMLRADLEGIGFFDWGRRR